MYKDWKIKKWDTPVSDVNGLALISLKDIARENKLSILFETNNKKLEATFDNYPAYRNILEEYRLELWKHLDETNQMCGDTFIVINSPWIKSLTEREQLINVHEKELKHYVITTTDDVIEVLSSKEPEWDEK